jgi:hypothetical protein
MSGDWRRLHRVHGVCGGSPENHRVTRLLDGEIWIAHGGVNPCGLVVRRGDQELRTRWLC